MSDRPEEPEGDERSVSPIPPGAAPEQCGPPEQCRPPEDADLPGDGAGRPGLSWSYELDFAELLAALGASRADDLAEPGPDALDGPAALAELEARERARATGRVRDLTGAICEQLPAGPGLAALLSSADPSGLDDWDLAGVAAAWRKVASWSQARELATVAEMTSRAAARDRRPGAGQGSRPAQVTPGAAAEVALALTMSQFGASWWAGLAVALGGRLAATGEALQAGAIDVARARLIAEATAAMSDDTARAVEAMVLPKAGEQTTGQLRAALRRAVITIDPEGADQRRRDAERQADVKLYPDECGTAALIASSLPGVHAAAALARITAMARALQAAGAGGGIRLLRAQVLVGLLLGTLPLIPPAAGAPPDPPDTPDTPDPPDAGGRGDGPGGPGGPRGSSGPDPDDAGPDQGRSPDDSPPGDSRPPDSRTDDSPPGDGNPSRSRRRPRRSPPDQPGRDVPRNRPATPPGDADIPPPGDEDAPPPDEPCGSGDSLLESPWNRDDDGDGGRLAQAPAPAWSPLPATITQTPPALGYPPGRPGLAVPPPAARDPGRPLPASLDPGRPAPGQLDLTLAWTTLTGTRLLPAHLSRIGPITAAEALPLAGIAALDPHACWRIILTDPGGHALAVEAVCRRRDDQSPSPARPPGVIGRVTVTIPTTALAPAISLGRATTGRAAPGPGRGIRAAMLRAAYRAAARVEQTAAADAASGGCAHTTATSAYRPTTRIRDYVQARDQTCRQPTCRQPATHTDLDHTIPHHHGGPTCPCNLGPRCRTHHQIKQLPGWTATQPQPGHFTITTPAGRTYTTHPDPYPT